MIGETTTTDAANWAATVSRRQYAATRHELDELLVATDPAYRETVDDELQRFETAVAADAVRYEAINPDTASGRPARPTRQLALFWVFFLTIAFGFGIMLPIGGRSLGAGEFPDSSWQYLVPVSAVLFVIGVVVQLIRSAPLLRTTPPVRDLAWLPTVLGVPALLVMVVRVNQNIGVDVVWVVVTALALAVSLAYGLLRLVQRGRNPALAKRIDTAEGDRLVALRDGVHRRADEAAQRIATAYAALPEVDRARIAQSLDEAREQLQSRGLIRTTTAAERQALGRGSQGNRRPMVPGYLLLSRKVQDVWHPRVSVPKSPPKVRWLVGEFEPEPAKRS